MISTDKKELENLVDNLNNIIEKIKLIDFINITNIKEIDIKKTESNTDTELNINNKSMNDLIELFKYNSNKQFYDIYSNNYQIIINRIMNEFLSKINEININILKIDKKEVILIKTTYTIEEIINLYNIYISKRNIKKNENTNINKDLIENINNEKDIIKDLIENFNKNNIEYIDTNIKTLITTKKTVNRFLINIIKYKDKDIIINIDKIIKKDSENIKDIIMDIVKLFYISIHYTELIEYKYLIKISEIYYNNYDKPFDIIKKNIDDFIKINEIDIDNINKEIDKLKSKFYNLFMIYKTKKNNDEYTKFLDKLSKTITNENDKNNNKITNINSTITIKKYSSKKTEINKNITNLQIKPINNKIDALKKRILEKHNYKSISEFETKKTQIYDELEIEKDMFKTTIEEKISSIKDEINTKKQSIRNGKANINVEKKGATETREKKKKLDDEENEFINKKYQELEFFFKKVSDEYINKSLIYFKSIIDIKIDKEKELKIEKKDLEEEQSEKAIEIELLQKEIKNNDLYIDQIKKILESINLEKSLNNKKKEDLLKLDKLFFDILKYNKAINKIFENIEYNSYQNKILYFIIKDDIKKIILNINEEKKEEHIKLLNKINEYFIKKNYNFLKEIKKYNDDDESNYFFESYNKHFIEIEKKINNLLLSVNSKIITYQEKPEKEKLFSNLLKKKIYSVKKLEPNIEIIFNTSYEYTKITENIKNNKINIPPYTNIYFIYIIFLLIIIDYLTIFYQ